ncbi:hypothetical protein G6F66_014653 [Rhizopus arrhizus]|nr:hypothetical protein G6F66_014653 [Rhizopus arrhizus]
MRQIARLRARALHDLGVHRQHLVEIVDQRLDLAGKAAFDAAAVAGVLLGQLTPQARQRPQPAHHLDHRRRRQSGGKRAQRNGQHMVEAADGMRATASRPRPPGPAMS